jgi:hypothetical protein
MAAVASSKPPHLKECHCCEDCKHYNGHGKCLLYEWPVEDHNTCDSFEAIPKTEATKRLWAAHRRRLANSKSDNDEDDNGP